MSSRTRLALAGAAAAATAAVAIAAPSANAAPTRGGEFTVTCPGEDPFTVVVPGSGPFTPAFIEGTRRVIVVYQIIGEILVPGEEPEALEEIKKAPVPADAVTCTFVSNNFGEVTVTGTVVGVLRGHS
jgi:hypothetical protein